MKITALLVEPTLIGLAVLTAIALAASPALDSWLLDDKTSNLVIVSAIAYFLGITFDRTADTILNRFLVLHRLAFSRKLGEKSAEPKVVPDPFPEDLQHLAIAQGPAAWEYLSYHRSRIRLTRAILVLTPALAVAIAIRLADEAAWMRWAAIGVTIFVYALAFAARSGEELPKTDSLPDKISKEFDLTTKRPRWRFAAMNDKETTGLAAALSVVPAIVLIAGGRLAPPIEPGSGWAIAFGLLMLVGTIAALALLFASWWRITQTYFEFLANHARLAESRRFVLD